MTTATKENETVSFSYDNRNRVASTTDVWGKTITYTYDTLNNRTQMGLDTHITTYQYDNLNRIVGMIENAGNSVSFAYDTAGRLSTRTINNLLLTTYSYNGMDQLTNLNYTANGTTLKNFQYAYNNALNMPQMNMSQMIDSDGTHNYLYDDKSQLKTTTLNAQPAESFTYDSIGNHLNTNGTLLPPQGVKYLYDANGDLKLRVNPGTTPVNKNINYKYDVLGRLVGRVNGTQWTRYTYDGNDIILDQNGNGDIKTGTASSTVYYGNGPGIDNKLWYKVDNSSSVFFLSDLLRSTRALVSFSSNGSISSWYQVSYDSFGVPSTQLPTRFLYTGREYDYDTQLYYYRARWYDPQARRFISEDPIGLNGGINLYAYVENNPVNHIDPLGLKGDRTGYYLVCKNGKVGYEKFRGIPKEESGIKDCYRDHEKKHCKDINDTNDFPEIKEFCADPENEGQTVLTTEDDAKKLECGGYTAEEECLKIYQDKILYYINSVEKMLRIRRINIVLKIDLYKIILVDIIEKD